MPSAQTIAPPWEAVLAGLPVAVAVVDGAALTVRWANAAFLELLDPEDAARGAAGLPLERLSPPGACLGARVEHVIASGTAVAPVELETRPSSGRARVSRLSIAPLPREDGGRDVVLVAVEITEEVDARRRAEALAALSVDLGRGQRLAHVLAAGTRRARALLGDRAAIWTWREGRLVAGAPGGATSEKAPSPSDAPSVAEALATGLAMLLVRAAASAAEAAWLEANGAGAALLVPLVTDDRTLGLLVVPRTDERAPQAEDVALAGGVASQIALAAAKMTAIELERRNADRLALLQTATAAFSAACSTEEVAAALFDHGSSAVGADFATLVFRGASGEFETVASRGLSKEQEAFFRTFAIGAPFPTAAAVRLGEPLWLDDPAEMDLRFPDLVRARRSAGHVAWASLPLLVRGEAIGGVGLAWTTPHRLVPEERAFLTAVVEQCAQAVDRARLLDAERSARARAEDAEAEARRVGEAQERIMAVVGHDLRTPLSSITLATRRLYDQGVAAAAGPTLGRIAASAARMATIVRDLVDFGRVRSGGSLSVERAPVDVAAVCERAIRELQDLHPDRELELDRGGDTTLPADPDRLAQLVSNLVANAVHHGGPAARVRVRVVGAPDEVRLEVEDDGAGIPPDGLASLFEPFHRRSRTGGGGGAHLGLGLFIVREIARAHGGDVAVASGADGTTFTVRLPRATPGEARGATR